MTYALYEEGKEVTEEEGGGGGAVDDSSWVDNGTSYCTPAPAWLIAATLARCSRVR